MRSILVIDPNPELRGFVAALLRGNGHTVRETDNVHLAAGLLRAARADLVVTDLGQPKRDGAETIEALRGEFAGLEIIAISGAPHATGYLRLAASLGGRRTLAQPFMSRELMNVLNEVVAGVAAHTAYVDYQSQRNSAVTRAQE